MIELLSRHPDILGEPKGLTIEPLPIDEETSSLSAIIMDDDFYHFTIQHSKLTNGIRHADSAALIALKARAYLNLLQDKANGKHVNSKDIKKHRSDVLKNVVIMENSEITAPEPIVACIKEFVSSIRNDWDKLSEPLARALDQNSSFIEAYENTICIRPPPGVCRQLEIPEGESPASNRRYSRSGWRHWLPGRRELFQASLLGLGF